VSLATQISALATRIATEIKAAKSRANHTGTQPASTISDLSTVVATLTPAGAELAYAERVSGSFIVTAGAGSANLDITGLNVSIVVPPSGLFYLEFWALVNYVGTGPDAVVQIVETTGGGSTVVTEAHGGRQADSSDFGMMHARWRMTGTPGATRTFKATAVRRAGQWTIPGAAAYPAWMGAFRA
jgi:hypothetical protein